MSLRQQKEPKMREDSGLRLKSPPAFRAEFKILLGFESAVTAAFYSASASGLNLR